MSKKEIANTLKRLREQTGLTADEVGSKIGKSGKTVNAWENGRGQPDADVLIELCKIYKVDNILAEFNSTLKSNYSLNHDEQNIINKYRELDEFGKKAVNVVIEVEIERMNSLKNVEEDFDTIEIPYYEDKAAAGSGYMLNDNGYEMFTVKRSRITERADFIVSVYGASMEPEYYDGDKVLVHAQPDVYEGEIGIFIINGDGFIKQKGSNKLISLNRDYDDIYIMPDDNIICSGKVLGKLNEDDIVDENNKSEVS